MAFCAGLFPLAETMAMPSGSDLDAALEAWRAENGESWLLEVDEETGHAQLIYGGRLEPAAKPQDDAGFCEAARGFLTASHSLHGIDEASLVPDRVVHLPLSAIHSSDKVTVRFQQRLDGLPVLHGFVNVLMDTDGRLLSVSSTASPALEDFDTHSVLDVAEASSLATLQFEASQGKDPDWLGEPELVIAQIENGGSRIPTLVWCVRADAAVDTPAETSMVYLIDAKSGLIAREESAISYYDVSVLVQSAVTTETGPLHAQGQFEYQPMPGMFVAASAGGTLLATTASDGTFTIPGVSPPVTVTLHYAGAAIPAPVKNMDTEGNYSLSTILTAAQGNVLSMNPLSTPTVERTAQANAYLWINRLHDWILAANPGDTIWNEFALDKPEVLVNVNDTQCNSITLPLVQTVKFFKAGSTCDGIGDCGACANRASAHTILHETGHLMNHEYNGLLGPSAFNEGNADAWARYVTDEPADPGWCLGPSCEGPRSGENSRRFCGTAQPLCYGSGHQAGEVLNGALWKTRARLKIADPVGGPEAADALFLAWLNAFDDDSITPLVRTHFLIVSDNDGDLRTGTPRWADIDRGFAEQGFPLHAIMATGIEITAVTDQGFSDSETGPYPVTANIVANFAPPILAAKLYYRVNGGSFNAPLTMTHTGGGVYSASIPGQQSPAVIEYYIAATDSTVVSPTLTGQTVEYPVALRIAMDGTVGEYTKDKATPVYRRFHVGNKVSNLFYDFETPPALPWTSGGDANDWEFGTPQGKGHSGSGIVWTDPAAAYSGTQCAGNDLGFGANAGDYANDADNWLRSPSISLANVGTGDRVFLRFQRWLSADAGLGVGFDLSELRIIGTGPQAVWKNHNEIAHVDADSISDSWVLFEVEITGAIGAASSINVEWALRDDGIIGRQKLGGWSIDDVEVFTIESVD